MIDRNCKIVAYHVPPVRMESEVVGSYYLEMIRDGTVVCLYWHKRWRISTRTTPDISDMPMDGTDITYREGLEEALEATGVVLDKLDHNVSYNIGFTHAKMHVFNDKHAAWIIAAYDAGGRLITGVTYGFEVNQQLMMPLDEARKICDNALASHIAGGPPVFGYIVHTPDGSRYLVKSTLMERLEYYLYTSQVWKGLRQSKATNKRVYCALRAVCKERDAGAEYSKIFGVDVTDMRKFVSRTKQSVGKSKSGAAIVIATSMGNHSRSYDPDMVQNFIASGSGISSIYNEWIHRE